MKIIEKDDECYIAFTAMEESDFANCVMKAMSNRNVRGDFQELLEDFYYAKCLYGKQMINVEDFARYLDFCERYKQPEPDYFEDDKTMLSEITITMPRGKQTVKDNVDQVKSLTIELWKEAYNKNAKELRSVADKFIDFPSKETLSENSDITEEQFNQIEKEFWNEVDRVHESFNGQASKHHAYIMVVDYMPRGNDFT